MDLCVCSRCAVCIIQPQIFAPGHRSFSTLTVHRDPLFAPSWTQYLGSLRYGQQWFAGLRFVEFSRCCNLAAFQDRRPVCLTPCDWPVRPGLMPHINLSACPHRTNFHPGPNLPPNPPTACVVPHQNIRTGALWNHRNLHSTVPRFWAARI